MHLPEKFLISIFFTVEYCIGYLSHIFTIHSSAEERLSCYHFLAMMNRTAMNTAGQAAMWYEVRSFGHMLARGYFGMHFPCTHLYVYDRGRCAYVFMGVLARVCNAFGSQRSRSDFLNVSLTYMFRPGLSLNLELQTLATVPTYIKYVYRAHPRILTLTASPLSTESFP